MIVISVEGCHGCGKSSLIEEFRAHGYDVLDEGFMDMPDYALHPQTLLMETAWVCSWFERVLQQAHRSKQCGSEREEVLVADRSPFSAVYYANHGHLLEPLIRQQVKEIRERAGIKLYTIHVQVEPELLWSRIQKRLQVEPNRATLQENERSWMDKTLSFYNSFEWDMTINNNARSIEHTMQEIVELISRENLVFKQDYLRKSASSWSSIETAMDSFSEDETTIDESD